MVRSERRRALHEALEDLQRYRKSFTEEQFLAQRDPQRLVLQALYTAVQACLDEALEVCRSRGVQVGDTYRDAFLALGQAGILDSTLAVRLADWASFRNVLAHFYPVVDMRRVFGILDEMGDLQAFEKWLQDAS